jgi:hypothetical protein
MTHEGGYSVDCRITSWFIFWAPFTTKKASIGIYSGCDYIPTNLVCVFFGPPIPTSSFN